MVVYKQYGFTPSNFNALVAATGLNNLEFMRRFEIKKASFYLYKNGGQTMPHKAWHDLKGKAEYYIVSRDIDG